MLDKKLLAVGKEHHVTGVFVEFGELLPEVVDTAAEPIYWEPLSLHSKEPTEEDQVRVGILGAPTTFSFSGCWDEIGSGVVVQKCEADLLVSPG